MHSDVPPSLSGQGDMIKGAEAPASMLPTLPGENRRLGH